MKNHSAADKWYALRCCIKAVITGASMAEMAAIRATMIGLALQGYLMGDMPSANHVWGAYLREKGFRRAVIPDECPDCYTVADFAAEHPDGTYILALSGHVVCVRDGDYFDTWDSGGEVPLYYWHKEA